jgi:hypothetical protein
MKKHASILVFAAMIGLGAATASADLTHRYSFKDGGKDSAGKVDASLKGGAKAENGKLVLDNASKTSDAPDIAYAEFASPLLPKSGSASLVFWFNAKAGSSFARLLDIGAKEGSEGLSFIYITPATAEGQSRAAMSATDTSARIFVDNAPLDDGKEHMLAVVIDGTAKKLHVFIDGKEAGMAENLGDATLDKIKQDHTWLGRSGFDADQALSASIDEFRTYDTALTADEVAAIAKAGPRNCPPAHRPPSPPCR